MFKSSYHISYVLVKAEKKVSHTTSLRAFDYFAGRPPRLPKNFHYLSLNLLKMPYIFFFYIGSTIRPLHIRIKEHHSTPASSFHKHLTECKNNDNNFSTKIEAIVRNVVYLRIKEALLIGKLHPQINSWLGLNTEFITD